MSKLTLIEDYHPVSYWLENDNSLGCLTWVRSDGFGLPGKGLLIPQERLK
jgi:hypothetical protein